MFHLLSCDKECWGQKSRHQPNLPFDPWNHNPYEYKANSIASCINVSQKALSKSEETLGTTEVCRNHSNNTYFTWNERKKRREEHLFPWNKYGCFKPNLRRTYWSPHIHAMNEIKKPRYGDKFYRTQCELPVLFWAGMRVHVTWGRSRFLSGEREIFLLQSLQGKLVMVSICVVMKANYEGALCKEDMILLFLLVHCHNPCRSLACILFLETITAVD